MLKRGWISRSPGLYKVLAIFGRICVNMLLPFLTDQFLQDWAFQLLYVQPETVECGAEKTDKHKNSQFVVM